MMVLEVPAHPRGDRRRGGLATVSPGATRPPVLGNPTPHEGTTIVNGDDHRMPIALILYGCPLIPV
jgi:hypothetical protein